MRILAFEPFDSGSHRSVREAITRHSQHEWTWLTRPGRFWKWRMRTAAFEMIEDASQQGLIGERAVGEWDALFVTSLMSAADLRAMLPPAMRHVPIVLYMHENQAAYPPGHQDELAAERDLQFPLTNLTSILAADMVIWNSAWNRDSFLDDIDRIVKLGPDVTMPNDMPERARAKSRVIWPPVEWPSAPMPEASDPDEANRTTTGGEPPARVLHNAEATGSAAHRRARDQGVAHRTAGADEDAARHRPIRIAWPHRWEHDKGPDELLTIARQFSDKLNLRWTILGERYRTIPRELATFEREFASRIDQFGYVTGRDEYWQHLARCDWVLSTARHEFFGIAVVEAMLAGCLPWLPERLSYPELLPAEARGLSPMNPPADPEVMRSMIRRHLAPAIAPSAVARIDEAMASLPSAAY